MPMSSGLQSNVNTATGFNAELNDGVRRSRRLTAFLLFLLFQLGDAADPVVRLQAAGGGVNSLDSLGSRLCVCDCNVYVESDV